MHFFYFTDDRICRTGSRTERTTFTFIRIDLILKEIFTYSGRAFFIYNVSNILVSEISQSRKHRIRSRLSETAQSGSLDVLRQRLETVDILQLASSFGT